jgi:hypothetical protein
MRTELQLLSVRSNNVVLHWYFGYTVRKLLWLIDLKAYMIRYINYVSEPHDLTARNIAPFNSKWVRDDKVRYN